MKRAGGITFAQSPESAKYDGMPRAAIDTGMVDLCCRRRRSAPGWRSSACAAACRRRCSPTIATWPPDNLQRIFDVLRPVSGVDFRHYKLPTIKRRLYRRMALHRITDVGEYLQLLESNATEARSLYQDLLIHVTRFFRDPDSFVALASHVFPAILEGRPAGSADPRLGAGCATGEEAYSVAIALIEFLQKDHADTRVQIFATDVSESAIEFARAGVYPASIEADVSTERLRRFFTRVDGGYRVTKMVRDLCVFARQDLTRDPPFSHLDLILCRNVLIYMDAQLQRKLLSVFHYALKPGGFLCSARPRPWARRRTLFALVDKKQRIYRKKEGPTGADADVSRRSRVRRPAARPGARRRRIADRDGAPGRGRAAPSSIAMRRRAWSSTPTCRSSSSAARPGPFLEPAPGEASLTS